jgi:hypothetical protein
MRVGFGRSDITPDVGKTLGSVAPRVMTGVHDPLWASACVIDDGGGAPVALVGVDVGVVQRQTVAEARGRIERETGIPAGNVLVGASHTHTGGASLSLFNAVADPEYAQRVADGIVAAVAQAWAQRGECEIGGGSGRVSGIHFNRRFVMRDGTEATHPGKMHPDIVRPAGPVDPRVNVLAVRALGARLTGVVVNFGCHCTVVEGTSEYSADYVCWLREHLKRLLGDIDVVFLQGACGDVTQVNNQSSASESGHAWAQFMGTTLAAEVAAVAKRMSFASAGVAKQAVRTVPIRMRAAEDVERAPQPKLGLASGPVWQALLEREREHVAQLRARTPTIDCEVQGIRVGDVAIVANGAELFCQPALDIIRASPFEQTWVVTLANQYAGYVPTASAFDSGGYEVQTSRCSFLAHDAAQKLGEASLEVLESLK